MKKRKPPIVLATTLVLMLIAVPILFPKKGSDDGHGHDQPPPPPTAEQGERPKIKSSDVAGMASTSMSKPSAPQRMAGPAGLRAPGDGRPSFSAPKVNNTKPMPNDSSTSTQWYTNESKKGNE